MERPPSEPATARSTEGSQADAPPRREREGDDPLELGEASTLAGHADAPQSVIQRNMNALMGTLLGPGAGRSRVGRYLVHDVLGRGGMGTVFEAYDEQLERRVALKQLNPGMNERHAQRLVREAKALAKLSHPHVVQVYEVGEDQGRWFIAMELVEGETLRAWQQHGRSWRETVRTYVQAGQGLAAVHAAGLTHRDFKPDNCIVDREQRARVLDFGLVSEVGDATLDPATGETTPSLETGSLGGDLTKTGTVLGTLAYMPLEQLEGRAADARSDQFSFCVSLYEALYGERPFVTKSVGALMIALVSKKVRPPPKGSRVPATLRRVVLRGLSPDPEDRWPSMDELLRELQRMITPRPWRWIGAVVVTGLVGAGAALGTGPDEPPPCRNQDQHLAGIWDEARRAELVETFVATDAQNADAIARTVTTRFDAFASAWTDVHRRACEAALVHREQSSERMELQMQCLDAQLVETSALADVLVDASADTVERAAQAVDELPRPQWCDDPIELARRRGMPSDPEQVETIRELERRMAQARALASTGRPAEAEEIADALRPAAEEVGHEGTIARVGMLRSDLMEARGDLSAAMDELRAAYESAVVADDELAAAEVAASLARGHGLALRQREIAETWLDVARAATRRADRPELTASLVGISGALAFARGDLEQAHAMTRESLQLEAAIDDQSLGYASALHNAHAYELAPAVWYVDSPSGYAEAAHDSETRARWTRARQDLERALEIHEAAYGRGHTRTLPIHSSLARLELLTGDVSGAVESMRTILSSYSELLPRSNQDYRLVAIDLPVALRLDGQLEEAERKAMQLVDEAADGEAWLVFPLATLARVQLVQGRLDRARATFDRALPAGEAFLGPDNHLLAPLLVDFGRTELEDGEPAAGLGHLRRALELTEPLGADDPRTVYVRELVADARRAGADAAEP